MKKNATILINSSLAPAAEKVLDFFFYLWNHRRIIRQLEAELLKPFEVRMTQMQQNIRDAHITLESPGFRLVSMQLVEAFKHFPGAENYLSATHRDDSDGQHYEILIQRVQGKQPSDIVAEMQGRFAALNALPAQFEYFGLTASINLTHQRDGKWLCYAWEDDGPLLYGEGHEDEDEPIEFLDSTPDGAARQMIHFIREHQAATA